MGQLMRRQFLVVAIAVSVAVALGFGDQTPATVVAHAGQPSEEAPVTATATLPAGFAESTVATGMSSPTAMAFLADGRIFVAQQGGALRVIKAGALLTTPFLTVSVNSSGERGLLGVAIDPQFASNHYVYVYYTTASAPIHNRLSRFTANGDVALVTETILLDLPDLGATNHNGGAIHFGPDGKLYVAVGENAVGSNAQTLTNLLGKILRMNKDGTIPTDNPFYSTATANNRMIWSLGLRNPFTFTFQPGTGRMFINDVGQNTYEEINEGIGGSNFGWPTTEGQTSDPGFRSPLHWYAHSGGGATGCAITGGAFYNPSTVQFPASYVGKYFFADYCSGWIRMYDPVANTAVDFATGISSPVDLHVTDDGSLYYLYRGSGAIKRVYYTASLAPSITQHPANATVTSGAPASFTCAATGAATITYQWQRNSANISAATSPTYSIVSTAIGDNNAQFRCVATNAYGNATSNQATLTVTANTAPVATISSPTNGTTYAAGNTINYSGTGTDTQDGTLPASAFTWQIDFHHASHTHPFMAATTGSKTGSFVIPSTGETATNVWYRIYLTVRDSGNMTHTVYRDVSPRTTQLIVTTTRAGLTITVDGQPFTAPYTFNSVQGMQRSIGTTSPQTITSAPWTFQSWSDSGAMTHTITTPTSATTYTATFKAEASVPGGESLVPISGTSGTGGSLDPVDGTSSHDSEPLQSSALDDDSNPRRGAVTSRADSGQRLMAIVRRWRAAPRVESKRYWFDATPRAMLSRLFRGEL